MSKTSADASNGGAACELSRPLRSQLTAILFACNATDSGAKHGALLADNVNELRRRAALFALDNFGQLSDDRGCISEDGLYALLRFNSVDAGARPLISLLYRELSAIGHVIGERKSTSHVSVGGSAMPIHFARPDYAIDALDLFKLICSTARPQKS
jgi:hypothetical protein